MAKFIWDDEKRTWVPADKVLIAKRGQIITDDVEPFRSMADNRVYSSKSKYRRELRAHRMIEVGTERIGSELPIDMGDVRGDVGRAWHQVEGS